jgi:hypothetical protein
MIRIIILKSWQVVIYPFYYADNTLTDYNTIAAAN